MARPLVKVVGPAGAVRDDVVGVAGGGVAERFAAAAAVAVADQRGEGAVEAAAGGVAADDAAVRGGEQPPPPAPTPGVGEDLPGDRGGERAVAEHLGHRRGPGRRAGRGACVGAEGQWWWGR